MIHPEGCWRITFARDGRVRAQWQRRAYSRWYDLGDVCEWFHGAHRRCTVVRGGWLLGAGTALSGSQRYLRRVIRARLVDALAAGRSPSPPTSP